MSNQSQPPCSMLYNFHVSSWLPAGVGWAIYSGSRPSHGIQVSRRGVERDARYVHAQRWWFGGTTRMIPELWMVYVWDIRANYNKSSKPIRNMLEKLFVWKLVPLNIRANVCNGWRMSFGILGARRLTVASCCEKIKLNSQSNYCIFQLIEGCSRCVLKERLADVGCYLDPQQEQVPQATPPWIHQVHCDSPWDYSVLIDAPFGSISHGFKSIPKYSPCCQGKSKGFLWGRNCAVSGGLWPISPDAW